MVVHRAHHSWNRKEEEKAKNMCISILHLIIAFL